MSDKLEQLKQQFTEQVNESHVKYAWDGGWCYSYIDHELMVTAETELLEESSELEEWEDFTNSWLSEHEGKLYHVCDVEGDKLISQAETLQGNEAKEYAKGLVEYLHKYGSSIHLYSEKVKELQAFIDSH